MSKQVTNKEILTKLGKIEKKIDENKNGKKLEIYSNLFTHWDNSFWLATYIFFAFEGALIVAFTQSLSKEILSIVFSLGGMFISFIWLFVVSRKWIYTETAQDKLKPYFNDLYSDIENKKKKLARFSSSKIMRFYLPFLFIILWALIFLYVTILKNLPIFS